MTGILRAGLGQLFALQSFEGFFEVFRIIF